MVRTIAPATAPGCLRNRRQANAVMVSGGLNSKLLSIWLPVSSKLCGFTRLISLDYS